MVRPLKESTTLAPRAGNLAPAIRSLRQLLPLVVIVVAHRHDVVAHQVHEIYHRLALGKFAQRRPLEDIASLHQQKTPSVLLGPLAFLLDDGGHRRRIAYGRREIGIDPPGFLLGQVAVNVIGMQNDQVLPLFGYCSPTYQKDQGCNYNIDPFVHNFTSA